MGEFPALRAVHQKIDALRVARHKHILMPGLGIDGKISHLKRSFFYSFSAAPTNAVNSGCGRSGRERYSG